MAIVLTATVECEGGQGRVRFDWTSDTAQDYTLYVLRNGVIQETLAGYSGISGNTLSTGAYADTSDSATYTARITGSADGEQDQPITVNCNCDVSISSVSVVEADAGQSTGSLTVTASGTYDKQYSLDEVNWQGSNVFSNLPAGSYTVYARKTAVPDCWDYYDVIIPVKTVPGCTNPEADNYNPLANSDDGSCTYTPKFVACGGVLPNPVYVPVSFLTTDNNGVPKQSHYVRVKIYREGVADAVAEVRQTLVNGAANVDISRYLRDQFINQLNDSTLPVFTDDTSSFNFHVGIIEHYNGTAQDEVLRTQPAKTAVNAALQDYQGTLNEFIVS